MIAFQVIFNILLVILNSLAHYCMYAFVRVRMQRRSDMDKLVSTLAASIMKRRAKKRIARVVNDIVVDPTSAEIFCNMLGAYDEDANGIVTLANATTKVVVCAKYVPTVVHEVR